MSATHPSMVDRNIMAMYANVSTSINATIRICKILFLNMNMDANTPSATAMTMISKMIEL